MAQQFAIRVIDDSQKTIRPGDDMRLRFKPAGFTEYRGMVPEGDFVAVYDKKLLWRANLFLDETLNTNGTPSINVDWNDENIWHSKQGNEWDNYIFPDIVDGSYVFPEDHEPFVPSLGTVLKSCWEFYLKYRGKVERY